MRERALRWAPLVAPRTSKRAVAAIILRISVLKAGVLKVSSLMRWILSVRAELEASSKASVKDHLVVHSRVSKASRASEASKASEAAHNPVALLS